MITNNKFSKEENKKDKISVIISFYKVEKYIRKCIDSVINQTYRNLEIILVDDESPDDCGKICDKYATKDSRIKVIHKKNGGLSDARNAGIKIATGKYIAFVDGDDYIHPDMYRKLLLSIQQNDADIAICNFLCVDENGNSIAGMNKDMPVKSEILTGREVLENKIRGKWWYWTVVWNRLYKKDLFEDILFPVGKLHEDEFIAPLLWNKCKNVVCLKNALYMYVQRTNSIMSKKYSVNRMDEMEAHLDRIRFLIDNNYSAESIYHSFRIYNSCLAVSYMYLDKKDAEVKRRYKIIYDQYKRLYVDLMKNNAGFKSQIRYTLNYISPYYSWKLMSILAKLKDGIKYKLIKNFFLYTRYFLSYFQKYILLDTPTHGNLGDHAIVLAEKQVLSKYLHQNNICEITASDINHREYRLAKLTPESRTVFVHGGGFLGYLWPDEEERFRRILQAFKKQKIIVFPQTVTFDLKTEEGRKYLEQSQKIYSAHPNLTIFVREQNSFEFMQEYFPKVKCMLVPDIVTIMNVETERQHRTGFLFCMRTDKEKIISDPDIHKLEKMIKEKYPAENIEFTDTLIDKEIKPAIRKDEVMKKLVQFSKAKLVVTDRLHGMIFAAVTNTPCIAMGNINGKVGHVYEWIKNNSYIRYINDLSDLKKVTDEIDLNKEYTYNRKNLEKEFLPLIQVLKEVNLEKGAH